MMTPHSIILGIETSCDDTGVALYSGARGLIAHALHSQAKMHAEYGGVVPELASRDHIRHLTPMIHQLLAQENIQRPDAIAYTSGPGLMGALLIGAMLGRSLAYAWQCPAVGVHHLEGHLLAPLLEAEAPDFPFLALLVSGGHTQLIAVQCVGQYALLGESLDDAAGEAFDKAAKLLGLGYPGGPAIELCAQQGRAHQYQFPRPMTDRPGLDFSFSGLKTFCLNTWQAAVRQNQHSQQVRADIAYAFQEAVIDTLSIKCKRGLQQTGLSRLVVVGGVSANKMLRQKFASVFSQQNIAVFYPRHEFCTDNGAMIAYAGYRRLLAGQRDDLVVQVRARWPLIELRAAT